MLKKEFNESIRFKFLGVISITLFLSTVVLSTVIAINEREVLGRSLRSEGQNFASYIAELSQDPLIMKDSVQLDSIVHEANKDEDILYTVIRDARGNIATSQYASIHYSLPGVQTVLSRLPKDSELPGIITAIKAAEDIVELSVPIRTGNDMIGMVTIGMSQHSIRRQIVKTILFVFALSAIAACILGAVLFVASKKIVLTPITELSRAASRLAAGDHATRVNVRSTGEVQTLVDSFNRMAEDIEKTTVSKNYMDDIIDSMRDALIVASPAGIISRINRAASFLLEYDEEELTGQPLRRVIQEEPGDGITTLDTVLRNGSLSTIEKTFLTRSGKKVPVLFSASVMRDKEDRVPGVVCVAQDITARKRTEAQLRAYSDDLREVNEELKNFAYTVSHDLRAPLVNIKGFSEELSRSLQEINPCFQKHLPMLDETEREKIAPILAKDVPEALAFIGSSVNRMDNLINAVLKLSRAGRRKLIPEPVSVNDLVQNVLRSLAHQIGSRHISVAVNGLPDVIADRTALEQIFGNLIDNAVKYLDPGRNGEIALSAERNEDEITFHVRDNGRGIEPEDIPKVFEIFRRVGRQDVPGEGMGLSYVKTLVRLLGGRIWCESGIGRGTTFSFTLPSRRCA